jgi:hypothetical protein
VPEKLVVSSALYLKRPVPAVRPLRLVKPVLPVKLPVNKLILPPVPTLSVGVPEISKLPPEAVPGALLEPALSKMALLVVLVVLMLPAKVRSPVKVETLTVLVAPMPEVAPTVPMVSALLST